MRSIPRPIRIFVLSLVVVTTVQKCDTNTYRRVIQKAAIVSVNFTWAIFAHRSALRLLVPERRHDLRGRAVVHQPRGVLVLEILLVVAIP
jgi:hypothetical protein